MGRLFSRLRSLFTGAPTSPPAPSEPDPKLEAVLDDGLQEAHHQQRQAAIEALQSDDLLAFWLQAVGDGTSLDHGRGDPTERATPHQVTALTGYDDSLEYPDIAYLARHVCADHLGTNLPFDTNPDPDRVSATKDQLQTVWRRLYEETTTDDHEYPVPTGFDECRRQASALLETDDLTLFWLQVVAKSDQVVPLTDATPTATIGAETDQDHTLPIGTEFHQAIPAALPHDRRQVLASEIQAQHLHIAAETADRQPEQFVEQAVDLVVDTGYHLTGLPGVQ